MKHVWLLLIVVFSFHSALTQPTGERLLITPLYGNFYVFTTYGQHGGKPYPSNGLYVVGNSGVWMVDTPWDTTQFQPLLDSIWKRHHKRVVGVIATHFHEDRTAGLAFYRAKGIATFTTRKTDSLAAAKGFPRAAFLLRGDSSFASPGLRFQVIHPGPGHTRDNVVVWFPKPRILYAGCLVKSVDDKTLGNLADADVNQYATTLRRLMKRCPSPAFVIPGHNSWRSNASLRHSLTLAQALTKN